MFLGCETAKEIFMRTTPKMALALLILAAAAPSLSACYTMQGAGQDMSAAGNGLTNSADRNTTYKP